MIIQGWKKTRLFEANDLSERKSPLSEGEEHHVKNDDEIDESHKSHLKFEYEVYLLNYTIKIFLKP